MTCKDMTSAEKRAAMRAAAKAVGERLAALPHDAPNPSKQELEDMYLAELAKLGVKPCQRGTAN